MPVSDWRQIHAHILDLEEEGLVSRTFRRLDPARQQAILTAILDESVEKGPTSINIKRVAERAGVSVGSLYSYFSNREGLLTFAVELCVRFIVDDLGQFRSLLSSLRLRDAMKAYLIGGIEWSQTQLGFVQFFARAAYLGDPEVADRVVKPVAATFREMVEEILTRALSRGEIRPDVDFDATTRVVNALAVVVVDSLLLPHLNGYLQVSVPDMPQARILDAVLDLICQGIGAEGKAGVSA
jgi:AcrR family transcriptional regulator